MQYAHLGRTGLQVSRLCLGTMNFGPQTTEADAHRILDRALELGINFVDTANVYGWSAGKGATEEILGRWFAETRSRRDRVVLATKVFGRMGEGPNERGLSAFHIRAACEESLRRLKTDRIDLYQMHHIERTTPWEEIWEAMERLVAQGKVLYVGSSNFAGWHIATANQEARRRNFLGLVSEQTKYNLLVREPELEVIPACREYGVGLIPWSPLHGGALAGGVTGARDGRRSSDFARRQHERHGDRIERFEAFCREVGRPAASVAVAWLLRNPVVTAPIIGPRTLEQLESAVEALEFVLEDDAAKHLDEIFPGPGGEAPEAYAW